MDFVADGVELIEYLSGSNVLPTIILLDLNMPRKNGQQALKEIKSTPAFQNIPVVIFTTSKEENDVTFCRKNGPNSFLSKPSSFREWVEIMKSLADKWPVIESRKSTMVIMDGRTRNWWQGKKVLIAPRWIERISWEESKVFISLPSETIKQAPEYTEDSLITRDYETRLHRHYNRQEYWIDNINY